MNSELATWVVDTGDEVIQKRANEGEIALSQAELAVYCMWTIDYAVRNSGSFGPLEDMESTALTDLLQIARGSGLRKLAAWLETSTNESAFCGTYYEQFDEPCAELRRFYREHRSIAKL
ncbi:hypothetical protein [Cupriavidus basilensis]|jgi:hypothetical protein